METFLCAGIGVDFQRGLGLVSSLEGLQGHDHSHTSGVEFTDGGRAQYAFLAAAAQTEQIGGLEQIFTAETLGGQVFVQ